MIRTTVLVFSFKSALRSWSWRHRSLMHSRARWRSHEMLLLRKLLLHLMLLVLVLLMLLLLLLLRGYLSDRCHLRGDGAFLRRRRSEHGRVVRLLLRERTKHLLLLLQLKLFQRLIEPGAAQKQIGLLLLRRRGGRGRGHGRR